MYKLSLAAALLIAAPGIAYAQNEVEWKQTLSMPKGAHMPRDRADILGIEIGDTFEEANAKLLALWNEGSQDKATPPRGGAVKEQKSVFRLDSPGSQAVTTASFVKRLEMERLSKGAVPGRAIHDKVQVYLSSPASGHQVIAVVRNLFYQNEQDQPRVSEILDQMSRKMKGQPHVRLIGSSRGLHIPVRSRKSRPAEGGGRIRMLSEA